MNCVGTQCCGVQEISGLSSHPTPEAAMTAFCKHVFGGMGRKSAFEPEQKREIQFAATMYSFYTFTAAIYADPKKNQYGHNFAKFIKDNKLGQVGTVRAKTNHAFHPDHKVQPWVWRPSLNGLKKWWAAQLLAATKPVPPPVPPPVAPPVIQFADPNPFE